MIGQLPLPSSFDKTNINENEILMKLSKVSSEPIASLFEDLESSPEGLTYKQVANKRERYGPNLIITEKSSWYGQLFQCFLNPFNLVLLILAIISLATGNWTSVLIIVTMVFISVAIRFVQEYNSGKEAEKLKSLVQITTAVVRRDDEGKSFCSEIPVGELVPGDIITLSSGDMIPADIRLISARDLFVSQSMLTGESLPVEKSDVPAGNEAEPKNTLGCTNLCFMGTNVISGTAKAIVLATGKNTYFGLLAKSLSGKPIPTSFDIGINRVSWVMIRFIFVMAPLVFFINGFTKGDWFEAMMFAISVAVGLVPEMLPMVVTANLAKGASRMVKSKVVVKRLNSIHNLGAMDVLCTDKTGTLTLDKIILLDHLNINGDPDREVLEYGYLTSIHQTGFKNLMDIAIVEEVKKNHLSKGFLESVDSFKKIDELPFDFIRRRMSVIVEDANKNHILICKGAVEEVLSVCTYAENPDLTKVPLTKELYDKLMSQVLLLNEDGFRVLIVAYRQLPEAETAYTHEDEKELIVKGLLTFLDPPKESAYKAIPQLVKNGIALKVITGDTSVITRKVCKEVGLKTEPLILGSDIEKMSDEELQEAVKETNIFAKISPLQKSRIIRALKAKGYTVGFLGDGVNDAPALREADVGISVDTAVDIAKESADMILLEKSLMVINEGVIEGRKTFINTIKYIKMAISSNFGNILSVLGAALLLPFLPMLPLQLLIQNLLYDISQLAIPFDKVDKGLIKKPRNWVPGDLTRFIFFVGPVSSIFDYITFAALWFYFGANSLAQENFFQTGWFVEGLITQTLIIHMIRTAKIPFIQDNASLPLILSTISIAAIGIWLPFSPFASHIGMIALPFNYFLFLGAVMIGYWSFISILKYWYIKRFGTWL